MSLSFYTILISMAYKYSSRLARNQAKKSKRKFTLSIIFIILILYATLMWVLPNFIGALGLISGILKPNNQINQVSTADNSLFAPPVLTIPFESTNSSQIIIEGYAAPNSKVAIYVEDKQIIEAKTKPDGSFTTDKIDLSLGTNNIYGKTIDDKENGSLPSKTLKVFYDNEKPTLEIGEPEDNKTITGGDKKVTVKGKTDPGTNIFINYQKIILDSEGNFQQSVSINDRENILTVKARDSAGNETEVARKVIYKPSE